MLSETTTTLYNVQAVLLSMFNSETILIGHSLDSDFKALKLIHDVVVDTSVLYPHKMGPPKKRALKTLCIENLKRIIQENGKMRVAESWSSSTSNNIFVFAFRRRPRQCRRLGGLHPTDKTLPEESYSLI